MKSSRINQRLPIEGGGRLNISSPAIGRDESIRSFHVLRFSGCDHAVEADLCRRPGRVDVCGTSGDAQTKRAITLDDQVKERFVRDPELSPDGKWVAYTVTTADIEKDKRNSDLWMVSWDGTQQVQLTSSPDNESSPKWSPDWQVPRLPHLPRRRGRQEEGRAGLAAQPGRRRGDAS